MFSQGVNHFKSEDITFAITLVLIFFQKIVYSGEKRISESRIFVVKLVDLSPVIFNAAEILLQVHSSPARVETKRSHLD